MAAQWWGTVDPGDHYVLTWTQQLGVTLDSDGAEPITMQPGVPVMYPARRRFRFHAGPATQHVIRFAGRYLEAVAAAHRRDIPGRLCFHSVVGPEAAAALQRVIGVAAAPLFSAATSVDDRRVLNLRVAEAVVSAFDATPPSGLLIDAGPAAMQFAQEWMVANAHRPITVVDISRASGVGVRSLQASFQRHAGLTPMALLRQIRLHRVHADLLDADPAEDTIQSIARRWSFAHLGRFSGYYNDQFGELPSVTLRRRRDTPPD